LQLKLPDNYLISNAGSIAFCRLISAFSGAALDAVVLGSFGIGIETDAFFSALAVPLLIVAVLEVQAPNVLIPAFMQNPANAEGDGTWFLLRSLLTM
jgi:peptidoglycan biosynthesis protein MviN/MurJ (putative lipid II flippase)